MTRHDAQTTSSQANNQVRVFDTRSGQEPLKFVGFRDHLGFLLVIPFCQFAPHGIQAEFSQTAFRSVRAYGLFV